MIDTALLRKLQEDIDECMKMDKDILDNLRNEIRPLKSQCHRIQKRNTTSISLVATDGGNNSIQFDPYQVHVVRVVDSSNNQYCMEVVTPTTPIEQIDKRHFDTSGNSKTPLGELMEELNVSSISQLSPMIPKNNRTEPVSPSWVQVYRELIEWAVLLKVLDKDYGTDTVILFDGLLRSKVFKGDLFNRYISLLDKRIQSHKLKNRRVYIAGIAKHSKVLMRYKLAMNLEGIMTDSWPEYVEVPRELEEKSYTWSEYARGNDSTKEGGEINKYVGGKMFFVKLGNSKQDPVWPVDIFLSLKDKAQIILGSLLSDSIEGFPIPFYPLSLQKAHENAALVDFDYEIVQDDIFEGIRNSLGEEKQKLDSFILQDHDPSSFRYE